MSPFTPDRPAPRIPLQPNPFASTALQSVWGDIPADVTQIHDAPFRAILRALKVIGMDGKGTSIVLTGAPGSGKTHLLGRLRHRIEQNPNTVGDAICIYVRCNASAATLWRHLRLSLASDFLRSNCLDQILGRQPQRLDEFGKNHLNVARVLQSLREGRNVLVASAWLRGEALTEADLAALNVKVEPDDEDKSREWEAKLVTHALLDFLKPTTTVLCFDQVEGLETYLGEQAGFRAFGQVISELHSYHNHLLLLSCIVSDYEQRFQQSLIQADKDRVFQYQENLRPIEWEPASQLVKARLDAAPALRAVRNAHAPDPWWPLNPDSVKPLFATTGLCLPRTLIQSCKKQFDACMLDDIEVPVPKSIPDFLQEQYDKNLIEARRVVLREGGDKILSESLPWLLQNSGQTVLGPDQQTQFANLSYRGPSGDTAVVLCYRQGNPFTNALKRIDGSWGPPVNLKILSDPSVQPKEGSKGARILAGLKQQGARQSYPLPEALAALHAIRNLTTTAAAGELTLEGKEINEQEATEWALSNLAPQVEQLRADLLQRPSTRDDTLLRGLLALLAGEKVIDAEAAARELSTEAENVRDCARRHPMHFGVLEGPPLVLFEAVEGASPEIPHA